MTRSASRSRRTKAALFAAAKHGAVLISPCVSDGERQIAHEALAAGFPLVTLHNKGFAKLQKPSGRHFDACGEGRLLMLAPAAWPYQPGEKTMTRFDATAMNRLCQWIVGEDAAEYITLFTHPMGKGFSCGFGGECGIMFSVFESIPAMDKCR